MNIVLHHFAAQRGALQGGTSLRNATTSFTAPPVGARPCVSTRRSTTQRIVPVFFATLGLATRRQPSLGSVTLRTSTLRNVPISPRVDTPRREARLRLAARLNATHL